MTNIITGNNAVTMTSLELVDFINQHRKEAAKQEGKPFPSDERPQLTHANFLAKVPKVLGETSHSFECDLPDSYGRPRAGYRFPKREACLMAMSYSYDIQAAVFDRMTELEQERSRPLTQAELIQAQATYLVEMERKQAEQAQVVARVEQRVDDLVEYQLMSKRPSNAEAITHIRKRMFAKYGIPAHVSDQVMRQLPYSPKPAGMVKNSHDEAEGSSYAVYWTKDVNTVFKLFVAECSQATPAFVTHPFIEGKFRLTPGVAGIDEGVT
ncbi:hypothetical protein L1889_03660 [Paenalcaligenes niemegkensis]|uniref:hypothetical protein n=1 Tax=Paenalcaligenes niemegkensis TaxID=2895469 RepID=UPI001EE84255|nr:hypothetical protein [Paenalcaligenes niemegkensis]MCQ9615906.1 hypothetical protein [Paenalcaligenes niemegkensis]